MRTYYVEIQNSEGKWVRGAKEYQSCHKAHSVARANRLRPARVLMLMRKVSLTDLRTALKWQAS